jgi:hypothetical protein
MTLKHPPSPGAASFMKDMSPHLNPRRRNRQRDELLCLRQRAKTQIPSPCHLSTSLPTGDGETGRGVNNKPPLLMKPFLQCWLCSASNTTCQDTGVRKSHKSKAGSSLLSDPGCPGQKYWSHLPGLQSTVKTYLGFDLVNKNLLYRNTLVHKDK